MTVGTYDCIVVGSGIVGAACAASFAKDGMQVALIDSLGAGLLATAAGMGHIVVMDDSPAQFLLNKVLAESLAVPFRSLAANRGT